MYKIVKKIIIIMAQSLPQKFSLTDIIYFSSDAWKDVIVLTSIYVLNEKTVKFCDCVTSNILERKYKRNDEKNILT